MASRFKRSVPVTVNDVLEGHVALDLDAWTGFTCMVIWASCRSAGR